MKGFKFSLEKVLKLRIDEEKEAIMQFKKAENELKDGISRLEGLKEEKYAAQNVRYIDNVMIKQNIHYQGYIEEKIKLQKEKNLELKDIMFQKKELLNKKNIEKKSLEKLKELKLNEFKRKMEKIEMQKNDEFATTSYYLKKLKGGE